jgi:hypothetical protein
VPDLHVADLLSHTAPQPTMNKIHKAPPPQQEQQQSLEPPEHPPPQIPTQTPPVPSVTETHASPPRLRKTRDRVRSNSLERFPEAPHHEPNRLQPRQTAPFPEPRGRSNSAQPPSSRYTQLGGPRVISNPGELGRPQSRPSSNGSSPPRSTNKEKLRRSWLPGGRSRSNSQDLGRGPTAPAWIMSPDSSGEYNTSFLIKGEKVPYRLPIPTEPAATSKLTSLGP